MTYSAEWYAEFRVRRASLGYVRTKLKGLYWVHRSALDRLQHLQGGGCAICGAAACPVNGRLSLDHDHNTGLPRGLLCASCNSGIGLLKDNPGTLRALLTYVYKVSRKSHLLRMRMQLPGYYDVHVIKRSKRIREAYAKWTEAHGGRRCEVTGTTHKIHTDHDHRCGTVRGMLANNLNVALGMFRERTDLMISAVGYLTVAADESHQRRVYDLLRDTHPRRRKGDPDEQATPSPQPWHVN